ncbi:hypothetical protein OZZ08_02035 [Malaciobacter mytili]|uniref:hypothetical protein n=1 Tax=Malaciobacter mytili TaxID=603050 RepID=UPI003BB01F54
MYEEIDNEFDSILPFRNQYRYTHLEQYEEHELLEMFSIELVLRYIDFHNTMIQEETYYKMESESDEDFEKRMDLEEINLDNELDEKLVKNFGLHTYEMASLFLMHPYNGYYDDSSSENITCRYYIKQPSNLNIDLDLNTPLEDLISTITKHKTKFDKNNSEAINLLNKINESYANKVKNAFSDFKGTFTEKKKVMIDALFTFDYVEARNEEIIRLNSSIEDEYNQAIEDIENESIIKKPSLNTSSNNCYFKEEQFKTSTIPPGTAKKNYYKIKDLITNSIF